LPHGRKSDRKKNLSSIKDISDQVGEEMAMISVGDSGCGIEREEN